MIYRADYKKICSSFNYLEIIKYLTGINWNKIENHNSNIAVFQRCNDNKFFQVVVPLNIKFSDYGEMMYKVAIELAKEQEKNIEEVVLELANPLADIVRVRINDKSVIGGSVLFEDAISLFNTSKKMIKYAAQDAINPRKYYGNGRICDDVHKFIDQCRFGQTEIGSYITNIVCPFVYKLESDKMQQMSLFDSEKDAAISLTRRTTQKLMNSLVEVKSCIENGSDLEQLTDRKQNIISVNFLESLENLNIFKPDGELNVNLKWAPTVKENKAQKNYIEFSHSYYSPINAVTQRLKKEQQADSPEKYIGKIKTVSSNEEVEQRKKGYIILVVIENDKKKTIRAELTREDYNKAVEAHKIGQYVRVNGKHIDKNKFECKEFEVID